MRVRAQAFWAPKAGNSEDEYEDAFAPRDLGTGKAVERDRSELRLAIADGATTTSFSKEWAGLLVDAYAARKLTHTNYLLQLPTLQGRWREMVRSKPLPWYAEAKLASGAFAALLGLTLKSRTKDSSGGTWSAFTVGDCCMAQIRGDELVEFFPIEVSQQFTSSPLLISSVEDNNPAVHKAIGRSRTRGRRWQDDDEFFLMSDALAAWFLREHEVGNRPWDVVRGVTSLGAHTPFRELIGDLRSAGTLDNDDVTLVQAIVT